MSLLKINKIDNYMLTTNFNAKEFFCKAKDVEEHDFDMLLVIACQVVRSWYNKPIQITSTFRSLSTNTLTVGAASSSQHLLGRAVDFKIMALDGSVDMKSTEDFHNSIITKGELFEELHKIGIRGFGLYENRTHLDTRKSFHFWNKKKH